MARLSLVFGAARAESRILDTMCHVQYIGLMNLQAIGRLVAEHRRAKGLTLRDLAAVAGVGRSTLAALESGKLAELGYTKLLRIGAVLDLTIEARPPTLETELMPHRHLSASAGRELTKAAIEDILIRGEFSAWRGLVRAARTDRSGRIVRRIREVLAASDRSDSRVRAFATLLPDVVASRPSGRRSRG